MLELVVIGVVVTLYILLGFLITLKSIRVLGYTSYPDFVDTCFEGMLLIVGTFLWPVFVSVWVIGKLVRLYYY